MVALASDDTTPKRRILITGCSGGGKSTLLSALKDQGYPVVEEPGRRIVRDALKGDGQGLPWDDLAGFAEKAIAMARRDLEDVADHVGLVFFDRGLLDAMVAYEHATGRPAPGFEDLAHCYDREVFLAPPWSEIYMHDPERRHGFEDAVAEYERLECALIKHGFVVNSLPFSDVRTRVEYVLGILDEPKKSVKGPGDPAQ